jgi:hypothetical protein
LQTGLGVDHARSRVTVEQSQRDLVERRLDRRDLRITSMQERSCSTIRSTPPTCPFTRANRANSSLLVDW